MRTRKNLVSQKFAQLHNGRIYKVVKSTGNWLHFLFNSNYEVQLVMLLEAGSNSSININIVNRPVILDIFALISYWIWRWLKFPVPIHNKMPKWACGTVTRYPMFWACSKKYFTAWYGIAIRQYIITFSISRFISLSSALTRSFVITLLWFLYSMILWSLFFTITNLLR